MRVIDDAFMYMISVGLLKRSRYASSGEPSDAAVVPASNNLIICTLLHAIQPNIFLCVSVLAHQLIALVHPYFVLRCAGKETVSSSKLSILLPEEAAEHSCCVMRLLLISEVPVDWPDLVCLYIINSDRVLGFVVAKQDLVIFEVYGFASDVIPE